MTTGQPIPDPIVRAAPQNNAELCDLMCRTHGIVGHFADDAWTSSERTPPLYPDAVSLDPDATEREVLSRIDVTSGCSVKDSFATLELGAHGFEILFSATWVFRAARVPELERAHVIDWSPVRDEHTLIAWEAGWRDGEAGARMFLPAFIDDPAVVVLRGMENDSMVAGAILNRSAAVVGLSNVFGAGDLAEVRAGPAEFASRTFPGLSIVGYESGGDLAAALGQGFAPVGPLRVWIKPG